MKEYNRSDIIDTISYLNNRYPGYNFKFEECGSSIGFIGDRTTKTSDFEKTIDKDLLYNKKEELFNKNDIDSLIKNNDMFKPIRINNSIDNERESWSEINLGLNCSNNKVLYWDYSNNEGSHSSYHLAVTGMSGSGKTNILRNIVKHAINSDVNHQIYMFGKVPKFEYISDKLNYIDKTKDILTTLKKIGNIINDRASLFNSPQSISNSRILFGVGDNDKCGVVINDRLYNKNDVITLISKDGEEKFKAEDILNESIRSGYSFEEHYNILLGETQSGFKIVADLRVNRIDEDGCFIVDPILVILDEAAYIYDLNETKFKQAVKLLEKIVLSGGYSNVHLVIASQVFREKLFTDVLKNNITNCIICGSPNERYGILLNYNINKEIKRLSTGHGCALFCNNIDNTAEEFIVNYVGPNDIDQTNK